MLKVNPDAKLLPTMLDVTENPHGLKFIKLKTLTGSGAQTFAQLTEKYVKRRMAIILDGKVRSAPVINEKIAGGSAQITGRFTHAEAADLAIVLRAGSLPAPVEIIQNLTVGASLGQDSINKGIYSGIIGTILVVGFMLLYYRISGLIAST